VEPADPFLFRGPTGRRGRGHVGPEGATVRHLLGGCGREEEVMIGLMIVGLDGGWGGLGENREGCPSAPKFTHTPPQKTIHSGKRGEISHHTHIQTHTHTHARTHTPAHTSSHTHRHIQTETHTHVRTHTLTHTDARTHAHTHTATRAHTQIDTNTYAQTRAHTHAH